MGARANYVLIEDGVISVYYSHWGAMSIPAVVINGPETTRVYTKNLGPPDHTLMDDAWAEGGILLDVDRRMLLFFGGENIKFSPPWQRLLLRMMRHVWQGWTIAWAGRGIFDIATYPGVADFLGIEPSSLIKRSERLNERPYTEAKIRNLHQNPWVYTVITVKWDDGQVGDYTCDSALDGYLLFGPRLLDILRELETDPLPSEENNEGIFYYDDPNQPPHEGVYFNRAARAMWVMHDTPLYSVQLERIEQVWSGWSVNEQIEGLGRQVALSGRNPALVAAPYHQVEAELIDDLMSGHCENNDSISRLLAPALSPVERREWLTRLLQEALQEDRNDRATS